MSESSWAAVLTAVLAAIVYIAVVTAKRLLLSASSQIHASDREKSRDDLSSATTFRLHIVGGQDWDPPPIDEAEVRRLVREAFNVDSDAEIRVKSLAGHPFRKAAIATLSFSQIPQKITRTAKSREDFNETFGDLSLDLDIHFHGFTPLHSRADSRTACDIVALSGLNGHAFGSFKQKGGPFMWLRDDLPISMPDAQVFIYGYDTKLQGGSSFQSLEDLGLAFKNTLISLMRENKKTGFLKPLILLGHSLGGLVLKEALCQMAANQTPDDKAVLKSLRGILFFGTPNQGMDIKSLIPMVEGQANEDFLRSLGTDSADLRRQAQQWSKAVDTPHSDILSHKLEIISYYETSTSPTASKDGDIWRMAGPRAKLVDRSSATHGRPWERNERFVQPIDRDHSELVKFRNRNDTTYISHVLPRLQAIVYETETTVHDLSLTKEQQVCLSSLDFPERTVRQDQIASGSRNTCNWILEHQTYLSWLQEEPGFLWLEGHPGSGKSTITKYALEKMSSSISNRAIVMSHFFHGRGSEIQQSPLGLFRALAYQLLKSAPTRLTQAIGKLREMGGQPTWQMEWLRSFLEKHICQACTTQPIVIFIDALDECVIEVRDYVANFLTDIIRGSTGACLKIFVSCRHYPNLFTEGSRMEMDNNSKEDLTIFVKSRLQTLSDWKRPIASQIIENARGSFQWAGIVTNKAIILHREGRTVDQIREEIKTIPKDIFELYDSLLRDLNNDDKQLAYRLFLWVCFARQPLTIRELQYALMLSPNMKEKRLKDIFQRADFRTELPDMVNMIVYLSRGLIEIIPKREWDFGIFFHSDSNAPLQHTWNSDVQVIHQTVVDYLLQTGLPRLEQSQQIRAEASGGHYHHFIAESCLRLVEMDDYTTPTGLLKTIDFMLSDAGCLSEYVASHFRTHLFELEDEGVDMVDLLRLLGWPHNKSRLAHISMLYEGGLKDVPDSIFLEVYLDSSMKCQRNPLVRGDVSRSKHLSLLHFLSGMGFAKTVKWMVENKLSGLNDDFLLDGSLDATLPHPDGNNKRQSLVVDGYYNPNLLAIPTAETALHLAVVKSRTSVFVELLKSPLIDPNIQDRAGRTPLHVTQIIFLNQNERRRMVERLLQSPGIKVDLQDIHGRTPFFYAAECGHVEDFQMLLDAAGDNLDIRDEQGFTALAAAAGMGNVAAVEVIINSGKCSREGLQLAYDTSARWQKKPSKSGYYTESERRRAPLPLILEFPEEIRRETVRVPEMQKCRRLLLEAHPSLQADASLDEEQGDTLSKWSD